MLARINLGYTFMIAVEPDSSGGVLLLIGLVRGSNPGGGEIFSSRLDPPWGLPSLLYNGYRVFPGGKAAEAWR